MYIYYIIPLNNQITWKRDSCTIYHIGNIFCLKFSGGCEGPTPAPPVSVPGEVFSSDSIYRDEEDDVEIREEDILEEIPIGEGDQAPEDLDDEEVK